MEYGASSSAEKRERVRRRKLTREYDFPARHAGLAPRKHRIVKKRSPAQHRVHRRLR